MRLILSLLMVLVMTSAAFADVEEVYYTKDEAVQAMFPDADEVVEIRRVMSASEQKAIEKALRRKLKEGGYLTFVGLKDGKVDAIAMVTHEVGKIQPFTFMVGVEPDGTVRDVLVMIYRESQGAEIKRERFRKQLRGKSRNDALRINQDVVNITGATLSCNAICSGVKKILVAADLLYWSKGEAEILEEAQAGKAVDPEPVAPVERMVHERMRMGATCRITVYAADRDAGTAAINAAFDEMKRVEALISDYDPDSELSRFNEQAGSGVVEVSEEFYQLLSEVKEHAAESNRAFDPVIGALIRLWGFRSEEGLTALPSDESIDAAKELCGADQILLEDGGEEAGLATKGALLDPGAWGKGYAVDRAVSVLKKHGIAAGLVDFGSTARAFGAPPEAKGWAFSVRVPEGWEPLEVVLTNEAISTSGQSEKYFTVDGTRYGHILNPRSGRPVEGAYSLTVICEDALTADIRSTAGFVLPVEGRLTYLESHDALGCWYSGSGNRVPTGMWRQRFDPPK
jgi:thiamine biosynthesis lipoprotein ApbE/Na+-translocating ferredoxin:NAD+ oxidoreductase RnfG subunit